MTSKPHLQQLRAEISAVDDDLLRLLARRLSLAKEVGSYKVDAGLAIKDYRVEKEVVERSRQKALSLGIGEDQAEEFIQLCIRQSVQIQDELKASKRSPAATPQKRMQVVIIGGLGQMGQWLAEFFDSFGHEILIVDDCTAAARPTKDNSGKLGHQKIAPDFKEAVLGSDLIVLATPISATAAMITKLSALKPRAIVFDICSLKSPLLDAIADGVAAGLRMTSVHPMFGPSVKMLSGHNILICDCGYADATAFARDLFAATTARVLTIPLPHHDLLMSQVLGLSHMINLLFTRVLTVSGLNYGDLLASSSTTFKAQVAVAKPVAAENQDLYFEIQAQNNSSDFLLLALQTELNRLSIAIKNGDREQFKILMGACNDYYSDRATRTE